MEGQGDGSEEGTSVEARKHSVSRRYSKRTLDRKKEKIPELIQTRKRGKRAFLVMDRLMVTDAVPNLIDNVTDRDNAYIGISLF